jgi:hypothetical protein
VSNDFYVVCTRCGLEATAFTLYDAAKLLAGHDCAEHKRLKEERENANKMPVLWQGDRARREMQV